MKYTSLFDTVSKGSNSKLVPILLNSTENEALIAEVFKERSVSLMAKNSIAHIIMVKLKIINVFSIKLILSR